MKKEIQTHICINVCVYVDVFMAPLRGGSINTATGAPQAPVQTLLPSFFPSIFAIRCLPVVLPM